MFVIKTFYSSNVCEKRETFLSQSCILNLLKNYFYMKFASIIMEFYSAYDEIFTSVV